MPPNPAQQAGAADETAVLPPVRDDSVGSGAGVGDGGPVDRVPPGYFRDERRTSAPSAGGAGAGAGAGHGSDDRTRELPQVDEEGRPRQRPRPDWAEETPLDDLPTLADELLGGHDDDGDEGAGGRRRGRR
jgi:dTMP kinase